MVELIKVEKEIDFILEKIDYEHLYKLVKDDKVIGYGTINKDKEDFIYIYINEEARGNQYGKFLFLKILEEVKNMDYKEVKVKFSKENIQMLKIVNSIEGLHLSSNEDGVKYLIPLR